MAHATACIAISSAEVAVTLEIPRTACGASYNGSSSLVDYDEKLCGDDI